MSKNHFTYKDFIIKIWHNVAHMFKKICFNCFNFVNSFVNQHNLRNVFFNLFYDYNIPGP